MSVIQTFLTPAEIKRLSEKDQRYLRRQLANRTLLNKLLNKPVHRQLLNELQCILDRAPLPRQKSGRFVRGQVSRLTDGITRPCHTRPMTAEERVKYGVKEVVQ